MGFVMSCNNRKCGKTQEPLLDKITNEVFCAECGEQITNVTEFAKNSMRGMSQFKREAQSKQAFPIKCNNCGKTQQPKLQANKLLCPHCGVEHTTLPAAYAHAVKQYLTTKSTK